MEQMQTMSLFERLKRNGRTADGTVSFLNEWNAVRYIGRGTFGAVYEIVKSHPMLGEQHSALKIIEMGDESAKRLKDEITALNSIRNHPHAVSIEDFSELMLDEGDFIRRYIVIRMELLRAMPKTGMSEDEVIKMGIDVSSVLADCHSRTPKILHCDIKPSNILLTENGTYKLSDFGEAKFLDKSRGRSGMRGTPFYMAPEMMLMTGYDERSDLYSLGVTMYTMLNGGKVPFYTTEDNESEAMRRRTSGEKFPNLKGVRPELLRIINKLCAPDPNKRYQNADRLNHDLRALVSRHTDKAPVSRMRLNTDTAKPHDNTLVMGETVSPAPDWVAATARNTKRVATAKSPSAAKGKRRGGVIAAIVVAALMLIGVVVGFGLTEPIIPKTSADRALARQFRFEPFDDGVEIAKYNGKNTEVEIPASYNDMPVRCIGDYAFYECENLTSITIPDSVTSIEQGAFSLCSKLESVTIPNSVVSLGSYAFYGCRSLTSVSLPDNITSIDEFMFYDCSSLTSIVIPDGVTSIGDYAFSDCSRLTSVTIPDSVTHIWVGAFSNCESMTSIDLPNSVTKIGDSTFWGCASLTSIDLPDSVTSIEAFAFSNCISLTTITIPDSVTSIGAEAFAYCTITVKAPHEAAYYGCNLGVTYNGEQVNKYVTWVVTD